MVIGPGHPLSEAFGGIRRIHANPQALDGYRAGSFRDGAVIVFDLLEAVETGDGALAEGPRKLVGVMAKDAARFAATGGWGFEAFPGGERTRRLVGPDAAPACFGCHAAQAGTDFVFSAWRD